jgi:hypothetical protein
MSPEELGAAFQTLTQEDASDFLRLGGHDPQLHSHRLLLHYAIVMANESGQPRGQQLNDDEDNDQELPVPAKRPRRPQDQDRQEPDAAEQVQQKLDSLEKNRRQEMVETAVRKVRNLSLQPQPSMPLIIAALDELACLSLENGHKEAKLYNEISRQAERFKDTIDIGTFCLSALGGGTSDKILQALTKSRKIKKKNKVSKPKSFSPSPPRARGAAATPMPMQSPLQQIYGQPQPQVMPMMPYGSMQGSRGGYGWGRGAGRGRGGAGTGGPCFFCGQVGHWYRDCDKMKDARAQLPPK